MKFAATNKAIKAGAHARRATIRRDGVIVELSKTITVEGTDTRIVLIHAYRMNGASLQAFDVSDNWTAIESPTVNIGFHIIANGFDYAEATIGNKVKIEDTEYPVMRLTLRHDAQELNLRRIPYIFGESSLHVDSDNRTWKDTLDSHRYRSGYVLQEFDEHGKLVQ